MLSLKNSIISLFMVLTLGLSLWSVFNSQHPKEFSMDTSHRPDAFMEEVVALIINQEGNPSLKIESPKMVHYAEDDTTDIEAPHITVYRQSPEPWHIHANYAKATQGLDKIFFWDNVIIHHVSDTANPTTTMTTTTLTVFPNKQMAQTNDHVTVTQPSAILHGLGMLANLNEGTVQLLSQAQGEYIPNAS